MPNSTDRRPAINSIRAVVRVQTPPEYDPRTGGVRPGQLFGFDTAMDGPGGPGADLLAVTTSKKLNEPCGRFTLTMAPRDVIRGSTWADLIPPGSLVEVFGQSYPTDQQPVLLMLGLTDTNLQSEQYAQAEPQRQVQIAGRELSSIFVDQRTLYLPVQPANLRPKVVEADFASLTDPAGRVDGARRGLAGSAARPATASTAYALFGMLAIDPELATEGSSPVEVIDRFVRMCTTGLRTSYNPDGAPLLNFDFPDARLKDLLFFDRAKAEAALIDPHATLPAAAQLIGDGHSLWNLMSTFSDPAYQELFAVSRDLSASDLQIELDRVSPSAMEIIFRKKPFAGRIGKSGDAEGIAPISGSQFDPEFAALDTVAISDLDVTGMSLRRTSQGVRNLYLVYPQVPGINSAVEWRALQAPLIDGDRFAPSSARRFGPRLMEIADYYLRLPDGAEPTKDAFRSADARQQVLWGWYRFEPLFRAGSYELRGTSALEVGKRLTHRGRDVNREYYVTGVTHSIVLGTQSPRFVTRAEVERGWPVP